MVEWGLMRGYTAIDYINEQIAERRQLVAKIEALGGTVPPELREP